MRKFSTLIAYFMFLLLLPVTLYAQSTLQFDEKTGLFKIRYHTLDVVDAGFVFWHDKWQWSGVGVRGKIIDGPAYTIAGKSKKTGLSLHGKVTSEAPNELTWHINTKIPEKWRRSQLGGISFKINTDEFIQGKFVPTAQLLPDNKGWILQLQPDQPPLSVRFEPPIAKINFERGRKNQIRAYFVEKDISQNEHHLKMTVSLPEGGKVIPTAAERLAKPSPTKWYRNVLSYKHSPVDLGFLNFNEKPAGKHGFIRADGENLTFEDGVKARFWGVNFSGSSLFKTTESNMRVHAKRLSRLGINLVRFHHHDSRWVKPNIFGDRADNTLSLDAKSLKKMDLWIKILREEGIYIWLDLQVGRRFGPKDDIQYFSEIAKGKKTGLAKGYNYVNQSIQDKMKQFSESYLSHVNPYTSLAYKDDPAIIGVLISNENDITHHFGNAMLPNKKVPEHNKIYMSLAQEFALKTGVNPERVWRSWEYGPSKLFLNDLEHQFNKKMIKHLKDLGVKVPIVPTSTWGGNALSSLPALTDGDIIDVHSYGKPDLLTLDPRYTANMVHWLAAGSVVGKPVSVTEWNVSPFPAFDRGSLPTYVASIASLQDFDAMMQYAYGQAPLNKAGRPSNWHSFNDPAALAMMPAAALLYRQGHVEQAKKEYHLSFPPDVLMGQKIAPSTSIAIRTLAEQSKLRIALPAIKELPWLKSNLTSKNAIVINDPNQDFIPKNQNFVCSDTQQICRNWEQGVITINTPKSQIASGWIGGHSIELNNLVLKIKTKNASIAVQSLDNVPLPESGKILISMAAQSVPERHNKLPFLSEPVEGILQIEAKKHLKLFALNATGQKTEITTERIDGKYTIVLDAKLGTYWLMLET